MRGQYLIQVFACLLLGSKGVAAQVNWPSYITGLESGMSQSPVAAVVPADGVVTQPESSVAASKARWSGKWTGWACQGQACDLKLLVEKITDQGATVVYAIASTAMGQLSERFEARFVGDDLHGSLARQEKMSLRMRQTGEIELFLDGGRGRQVGGILSRQDDTQVRLIDRVPTKFVENGKPVTLEVVIFKPLGPGPFPTVMFNHGSTGMGNNPAFFTSTWINMRMAKILTANGWLVAFPQRRGRGKSDGLYDEGFEANRSRYSCSPELSLPGVDRALADLDAALEYLLARPDVDAKRVVIGGQSRGGILSVAHAGTRPSQFVGVLNFVGGWMSDQCSSADAINAPSFKRGGSFPKPTLWLYGENDPFYKMDHSRKNFEAFLAAGGAGSFKAFALPAGQSGHNLIGHPDVWREPVEAYLAPLKRN